MKKLLLFAVLPLTIISFTVFTKWWFVLPVDAPDSMMYGFPFPFICNGWHTSMSWQVFIQELILNILIIFTLWTLIIFIIDRFVLKINLLKIITIPLNLIAIVCLSLIVWISTIVEVRIFYKRNFDVEVLDTGFKFTGSHLDRPELKDYTLPN